MEIDCHYDDPIFAFILFLLFGLHHDKVRSHRRPLLPVVGIKKGKESRAMQYIYKLVS